LQLVAKNRYPPSPSPEDYTQTYAPAVVQNGDGVHVVNKNTAWFFGRSRHHVKEKLSAVTSRSF
jgi:hypothetical protein